MFDPSVTDVKTSHLNMAVSLAFMVRMSLIRLPLLDSIAKRITSRRNTQVACSRRRFFQQFSRSIWACNDQAIPLRTPVEGRCISELVTSLLGVATPLVETFRVALLLFHFLCKIFYPSAKRHGEEYSKLSFKILTCLKAVQQITPSGGHAGW